VKAGEGGFDGFMPPFGRFLGPLPQNVMRAWAHLIERRIEIEKDDGPFGAVPLHARSHFAEHLFIREVVKMRRLDPIAAG
jgi:hypothetical protein